jgi:molecular chaperone HtpG
MSNASDACDKLRFEALETTPCSKRTADLAIRISLRQARGTHDLTVSDNGIGMSRDEVIAAPGHHRARVGHARVFREPDRRPSRRMRA